MLEKILEELEKLTFEAEVYNDDFDGTNIDNLICLGDVKVVIENHMNDGWIPVGERLPTKEEYLKDDGRFILDDGNRRYQGLFDIYKGKFVSFPELAEDKCVIAWRPLPEPYRLGR